MYNLLGHLCLVSMVNSLYLPLFLHFPVIFFLILVLSKTIHRARWLGWVEESETSVLNTRNVVPKSCFAPIVCNNVFLDHSTIWHFRLGHPSYAKISTMKNDLLIIQSSENTSHYSICHLAKQRHLLFTSNSLSDSHFQLVYCDIWGPLYTTYTLIHTQFGVSIKSIHSDNAPEFAFSEFFQAKGIISYHSCRHTTTKFCCGTKASTYTQCCTCIVSCPKTHSKGMTVISHFKPKGSKWK